MSFNLRTFIKSAIISIGRFLFLRLWFKYEFDEMRKVIDDNNNRLIEFEKQLRRIEDAVYFNGEQPIADFFLGGEPKCP